MGNKSREPVIKKKKLYARKALNLLEKNKTKLKVDSQEDLKTKPAKDPVCPIWDENVDFTKKDCETHYRGEGLPICLIFNYSYISVFIQIKNIITRYCNNKLSDKFPQRDWYF